MNLSKEKTAAFCGWQQTAVNKTGLWRFFTPVRREKAAPCSAGCPLQNNMARWVEKVSWEDFSQAWQLLALTNPFPAVTGHVCYRFCEEQCRRGLYDEPVAIGELEKQVGLWRLEHYRPRTRTSAKKYLPKGPVAIVGSGPAGLACAYYLTQLNIRPVVFEREAKPGGLLAWGIPPFRLPRQILEAELAILRDLGVEFVTGEEIDPAAVQALRKEFAAVFLATGAGPEKTLELPGAERAGVQGAVAYLRAVHASETGLRPRRAVIIGGGNTAMDAALTASLQGAQVTVVYRRSRAQMPAHRSALAAALAAGVQILENTEPVEIAGGKHVEKIILRKNKRETIVQKCDLVLFAVGQRQSPLPAGLVPVGQGSVKTNWPGIYVGGDARTGPATVAAAIAAGREAAREIASFLQVEEAQIGTVMAPPPAQTLLAVKETGSFWFDVFPPVRRRAGWQSEAARCLSCGHCNHCGVCWLFCPDLAIRKRESEYAVLADYCKGCGICVQECPAKVLELEEVEDAGKNNDR